MATCGVARVVVEEYVVYRLVGSVEREELAVLRQLVVAGPPVPVVADVQPSPHRHTWLSLDAAPCGSPYT